MHDAIEASANTQDLPSFLLNSGVVIIPFSRFRFSCPWRRTVIAKGLCRRKIFSFRILRQVRNVFMVGDRNCS